VKEGGAVVGGDLGQAPAHEGGVRGDPSCWEEDRVDSRCGSPRGGSGGGTTMARTLVDG
jgi:hypothetical protein